MSTLDEGEVLVGINTDDPQGTLDVNGRVYVSETTAPGTPASGKGAIYEKSDGKLYFKNDDGTEYELTSGGTVTDSFKTIAVADNPDIVADSPTDTLTVTAGSNITLATDAGADELTITSANTVTNAFETIVVAGSDNIVADSTTDTLTVAAGANVTITTNEGTDTLTIAATDTTTDSFKTIAVADNDNIVADSATDTLTIVAGSNVTLTTDAGTDTLTIASTDTTGGWTDDGSVVRLTTITDTVGIGVAVPDTKLHVSSGAGANGDCILTIESDTDNAVEGANPQINFTQDGGNIWSAIVSDDNELTFFNSVAARGGIIFATNNDDAGYTAAIERMRITGADGFVGIGVVAPQGILDISGAFYVAEISAPGTPSSGTGVVYVNSADSKIYFQDDSGVAYDLTNAGTVTAAFKTFAVGGEDSIVAAGATDTLTVAAGSNITLTTNSGTDTLTIAATDTTGGWTDDGGTVRLTTASDNVAIGTATATAKLTVDGDVHVNAGNKISIGETSPTAMVQVRNSGTAPNFLSCGAAATDLDYAVEDGEVTQFGTWNGSAATETMRISSTGDVGIGTTAPSEKLEVAGNLILDSNNATLKLKGGGDGYSGAIEWTFASDTTVYGKIDLDYRDRNITGLMLDSNYVITLRGNALFFDTADIRRMTIEAGGDVGIGVSDPLVKTHIRQDTAAAGAIDEVLRLESYDATGHNLTDANGVSMTFYVPEDTGSELGAKIEARRSSPYDDNTQTDLRFYTYADGGAATTYAMKLQHDGDMYVPRVYANTTDTAANINVNSSGHFQRYSSASKYKTDVEDVDYEWSEKIIAETRPVWYRSLCTGNNPGWSHWGFIAEEVGEVDPRLAEWNEKEDGSLEAEGVQYTKFIPHLLAVVQKQQKLIELLELRIAALEGA